jgi:hypothetical protein
MEAADSDPVPWRYISRRGSPVEVPKTVFKSVMAYIKEQANGNAVRSPISKGIRITRGTFLPGFGISSHS